MRTNRLQARLKAAGLQLELLAPEDCVLAERNARYMDSPTFAALVRNIKADGQLRSVPLGIWRDGRCHILSGNHRVAAAQQAGLAEIPILVTLAELTDAEARAVQLSHNAIVGEDDDVVLRALYDELGDVALKEYSGIDEKMFEKVASATNPLATVGLNCRAITLIFLDHQANEFEAALERFAKEELAETVILADARTYEPFLDAMSKIRSECNIKNRATAVSVMVRLALMQLKQENSENAPEA